ncbi:MAG: cysB [Planctomycetaceae bacterium]|nr:cysB [Planctomycetaceae bacterium]
MPAPFSLSTDQLAALIEVARHGSLHAAAAALFITEQGVRNRLIALEEQLGAEVYRKARGVRRGDILTREGRALLPHVTRLLEAASGLRDLCTKSTTVQEVHLASSQYLATYLLIDVIRRFHEEEPGIRVWLSVRAERDIEHALLTNPDLSFGVAAPYELSPELSFRHLFSMNWSLITPRRHPLAKRGPIQLLDLQQQPLILYERGSTGRQHVMEAFAQAGVTPRVEMEATTTDLVVRMVAAGLGVAIVPLLPSGVVTAGQNVHVRELVEHVRPIDSGLLLRRGETLGPASQRFLDFVQQEAPANDRAT